MISCVDDLSGYRGWGPNGWFPRRAVLVCRFAYAGLGRVPQPVTLVSGNDAGTGTSPGASHGTSDDLIWEVIESSGSLQIRPAGRSGR
jgi:hypothetical protein